MNLKFYIFIFLYCVEIISIVSAQTLSKNYGLCQSPDKNLGYCVLYMDCPLIKDLISKMGMELLKPENSDKKDFIIKSKCGELNRTHLICCEDSIFGNPNKRNENNKPSIPNRLDNLDNYSKDKLELLPNTNQCIVTSDDKVVGGTQTEIDEFPWTAVLLYSYKNTNEKAFGNCGGSLINNRYVITAAHCAKNKQLTQSNKYLSGVRLGEWDKDKDVDCPIDAESLEDCADEPENISIEKTIIHENYNEAIAAKHNDIALLRLSRAVIFTDFIKPICLPISEELRTLNLTGLAFDVTGWGKTENSDYSSVKLKANLKAVTLDSCNMRYKLSPPLIETQMCAGGKKGIDSCRGDSGGPLIGTYKKERSLPYYYLVGIVSVGLPVCGIESYPGIYTRVSSFIPWILRNIEK